MTTIIAAALAQVAIAILRLLVTRHDWIEQGRANEVRAALEHLNVALTYKADHPASGPTDLRDVLRHRRSGPIDLRPRDPRPPDAGG